MKTIKSYLSTNMKNLSFMVESAMLLIVVGAIFFYSFYTFLFEINTKF